MAYEQKNNQGAMFVNDKQGNESRPDYRGSITVDGKEYWLSGWKKATREGKKWLSVSVQTKTAQQGGSKDRNAPMPNPDEPF